MNSHFQLDNPNLGKEDILYHIGLTAKDDLQSMFQDVKFVCMGGKPSRMQKFAAYLDDKLGKPETSRREKGELLDISGSAGRYSMYKAGPVLSVSHGIGQASLSVVLNEILKLLHYAKCNKDVIFIRIGSSGGLGVEPGTLVITDQPYNSTLEPVFLHISLGRSIPRPCSTCPDTRRELLNCSKNLGIPAVIGNTMATDDFFEGQCRLDGAFCDYSDEDKMNFLKRANQELGVKNIEMESTCFSAMCNRANVKSAVICSALLNRLQQDVVDATVQDMDKWQQQSFEVVAAFISNTVNDNVVS
uniref:uridine phosphorylase 1-like n=1 Tax=Styela clava TaxID=7725 RepID=UPI00193994EF|nr:uridine phosphorylase 1-like [Styela clava]